MPRRLLPLLFCLSTVLVLHPARLWPVEDSDSSIDSQDSPWIHGGYLEEQRLDRNLEGVIPLGPQSRFHLHFANEPDLDIFYRSFSLFYEQEANLFALNEPALGPVPRRFRIGLATLPDLCLSREVDESPSCTQGKTLLMASTQLDFEITGNPAGRGSSGVYMGVYDTIFARWAYNLGDLAPSIRALSQGQSLSQVLADLNSGLSYSTIKNRLAARLGLARGRHRIGTSIEATWTDFYYTEYSAGLSYELGPMLAGISYDWASYETLNGIDQRKLRARVGLSGTGFQWSIEQTRTLSGIWSLGVYASFTPGMNPVSSNSWEKRLQWLRISESGREQGGVIRNEYLYSQDQLLEASYVPWDESLLERNDLTVPQLAAILTVNETHKMYDYDRVLDLNYRSMRSAREYINSGGICRDAANATAELLINSGHKAKIVVAKHGDSSPHAFVVAQGEQGSFYLLDYEWLYELPGAGSFCQAASSYSRFLTLMLVDPETHRVTDIIRSPDAEYLDTIMGMEERVVPWVAAPVERKQS